jgi:uncharacterized protein (TIGR02271 family)
MEREHRSDRFTAIEDQYAGYEVYDRNREKIGKVDDLFVGENDRAEYLGVKMGFLGLEGTSLIPWELTRVDEQGHRIEVSVDKAQVKEGPSFNDDEDITPEYENEVLSYYGVGGNSQESAELADRGAYGDYYGDEVELRVQRTEEELRVGTREREAGTFRVRKRVRTEREQISVPTRHEEVSVDRVPVNEEATGAEIGQDEVSMPVVEDEVVVEKRPVVKEEVRVRKDVVEEEELVEEDVRKEEVEVEDRTHRLGDRAEHRHTEGETNRTAAEPGRRAEAEQTGKEDFIEKAKRKLQGQ